MAGKLHLIGWELLTLLSLLRWETRDDVRASEGSLMQWALKQLVEM